MIKHLLTSLLLLSFLALSGQAEKHSRIRLQVNETDLPQIAALGLTLDITVVEQGRLVLELSASELQKLRENNFPYEVLIEDLTTFYAERNYLPESRIDLHSGTTLSKAYPVPSGFSLGSLGGFSNYEESMTHLDNMFSNYPELITPRRELGPMPTQEGRPVYLTTITNRSKLTEKAKVFYTGMIHAREPVAMQHLLYFMYFLLENYESDSRVTYLLDHAELYFIPILNPDGYIYNQQIAPNGGGMWRKNRRINEQESFGVDLNRNFGYQWGYDNLGSSPDPNSLIYRGPGPFSEPETAMVKQLCEEIHFTIALNYHSYSNLLLFPWGYIKSGTPDNELYATHAGLMTSESGYITGQSSVILYLNNGGTDDWMYGEQITKPKIFAYTPEVGSSSDGFWPAINRIIPLCQENMHQSLLAGLLSLHYGVIQNLNPPYVSQTEGYLHFGIQRMGFEDNGSFTLSLEPISEWIIQVGNPVHHGNLNLLETINDSIYYSLQPGTPAGSKLQFLVSLDNGSFTVTDTISLVFGTPVIALYDDCSTLDNWTGDWGLTQATYISPPSSVADSPFGSYPDNANTSITTIQPADLSDASWAELSFWAKWDIEAGFDYVQLTASFDEGLSWIPLQGNFTNPGSSYQLPGQPVYDGSQPEWVHEKIDLSEFLGETLLFKFTLVSNFWINGDGFYFDDFTVTTIPFEEVLTAMFISDSDVVLEGSLVQFHDVSSGSPQYWQWIFDGGEPETSNQQNPSVYYANPGIFDVSLIVENDDGSDTLLVQNYMLVLDSMLCRPQVYAGADIIITPFQQFTAIQAQAENYKSLTWTTSGDGTFTSDTILNTTYIPGSQDILHQQVYLTLTAQPHYEVCNSASHTLELSISDNTGMKYPASETFSIYPNPASDFIFIHFSGNQSNLSIELYGVAGNYIRSQLPENKSHAALPVWDLKKGVYFLRITSGEFSAIRKIVLIR